MHRGLAVQEGRRLALGVRRALRRGGACGGEAAGEHPPTRKNERTKERAERDEGASSSHRTLRHYLERAHVERARLWVEGLGRLRRAARDQPLDGRVRAAAAVDERVERRVAQPAARLVGGVWAAVGRCGAPSWWWRVAHPSEL